MANEKQKVETVIRKLKALEQSTRHYAVVYRQARQILEQMLEE